MIPFDFDSIFTSMTITLPAPHLLQIKVPQHGVDTEQVRSRYGVSTEQIRSKSPNCNILQAFAFHRSSLDESYNLFVCLVYPFILEWFQISFRHSY